MIVLSAGFHKNGKMRDLALTTCGQRRFVEREGA